MADKYIKQINLGSASTPNLYDIYDDYARRRLEGLSNVYSISCLHAGSSSNTYVDYITGKTITYTDMSIANLSFKNGTEEAITITKTEGKTTYLVLESKTTAGAYYAIRFLDMNLGDTVYVIETEAEIEGQTVKIPDRWLSNYVENTSASFSVLDGKIDLKEYAKKSEAGKAGSYTPTTSAASTETSGGSGELSSSSGTATVTYKKSAEVTGEAASYTVTSSSAGAGEAANTGEAGGVTISGSNFSFTGDAATISSSGKFTPAGTVSKVSASSHSHTVGSTAATINDNVTGTATGSAGAHTHEVSVSGQIVLQASEVKPVTGTVTYTPDGSIEVSVDSHEYTPAGTISAPGIDVTTTTVSVNNDAIKEVSSTFTGTGATISISGSVTGTGVADHAAKELEISGTQSIAAHSHTATQTVAAANKQSVVTGLSKFNGGTFTFTQGVDTFTPNVPTALDLTKFNGGSQASFTQGSKASFTQGSKAAWSAAVDDSTGILSFSWTANGDDTFTANGDDSFTANTVASLGTGFYTAGSTASFAQGTDTYSYTAASLGDLDKADVLKSLPAITIGDAGAATISGTNFKAALPSLTHSVTQGSFSGSTTYTPAGTITNTYTAAGTTIVLKGVSAALATVPVFTGTKATLSHSASATFTGTGVRLESSGGETTGTLEGTAKSAGAHTHSLTNGTLTYISAVDANTGLSGEFEVTPTFTGTEGSVAVSASYTPTGDIGGSQTVSAHSHSYTKPTAHTHSVNVSAHTHSIALSDATATGTASVKIANHTHSIGHTHTVTVTIPNCES